MIAYSQGYVIIKCTFLGLPMLDNPKQKEPLLEFLFVYYNNKTIT